MKRYPKIQVILPTQYGKKIADETPVLTSNGWKNHGSLEIGDYVYNEKGNEVKILNKMNEGIDCDVEIEFTNNEKIVCHRQHEWILESKMWKKSKNPSRIMETQEIMNLKNYKIISLPIINSLKFRYKDLPIHPYVLGCWLGDGTSESGTITFHKKDTEHIEKIKKIGYKNGSVWKNNDLRMTTIKGIKIELKKLNLINNKHIPEIYKYASIEQRLELLAGFIDTDGTVNNSVRENGWRNSRVYLVNTNKKIIDGFKEIINSLGIRVSITKVNPCISSSGIVGKKDVYYLGFQPFVNIPTALPRKRINKLDKKRRVRIRNIKKVKAKNGKCITVEGGIYLIGKELIPTHNSLIVALSCLFRATLFNEKNKIVAPSEKKADIIMNYVRTFAVENPLIASQLELSNDPTTKNLERLKRERSKKKLTFKRGGEIETLTLDARNSKRKIEAAMGFGVGDNGNVFFDESSLVDDMLYATVLRMLSGKNTMLFEIGNPFYRNHFYKTWKAGNHFKIFADYKTAIKEGRFTNEFIESMKDNPFFDVYYECKFPNEEVIDYQGYRQLLTSENVKQGTVEPIGEARLGCDIGGGGDFNVYIMRYDNYAYVVGKNRSNDTMVNVTEIRTLIDDGKVKAENVFIDDIGIGRGVTDRLKELGYSVNGVSVGGKSRSDKYSNLKAELVWKMGQWIKSGNKLEPYKIGYKDVWDQLTWLKYKVNTDKVLKIEPKEDLKKRTGKSPDFAEALYLTFYEKPLAGIIRF